MIRPKYVRVPDPTPGVREYDVLVLGSSIGTVANRPGGWWRAYAPDGRTCGSWHYTRKAATEALYEHDRAAHT